MTIDAVLHLEPDDVYELVPLKVYAAERGKSERTVRRWIHAGRLPAERDGPMPHAPWLVKVIRQQPAKRA